MFWVFLTIPTGGLGVAPLCPRFPATLKPLSFIHTRSWEKSLEPPHDKTNKMSVRPARTQISLGIRPVWSESPLSARRNTGSLATHWARSEDSDQTGRMLILLVLSCRGSLYCASMNVNVAKNTVQDNHNTHTNVQHNHTNVQHTHTNVQHNHTNNTITQTTQSHKCATQSHKCATQSHKQHNHTNVQHNHTNVQHNHTTVHLNPNTKNYSVVQLLNNSLLELILFLTHLFS